MQLNQLITSIEQRGYTMLGDKTFSQFPRRLTDSDVMIAPAILIPQEPPVQSACVMVPDMLTWAKGLDGLEGYVRIEAAASVVGSEGVTIVRLQFVQDKL